MCAFFIKRGAKVTAIDESQDSALHWAAYKGLSPVIGLLSHIGWNSSPDNNQIPHRRRNEYYYHHNHHHHHQGST